MLNYIIRRLLYALPIIFGVNIITFLLFFVVNSPDDMARRILGEKRVTQEAVEKWKKDRGYDLPLFYNSSAGGIMKLSDTVFFTKSARMFIFDFGKSDRDNTGIISEIRKRMVPSLSLTLPAFIFGLFTYIFLSMLVVYYRNTAFDIAALLFCVTVMSISSLFYIISFQFFFGRVMRLAPISGFEYGLLSVRFLILPVLIAVFAQIGSQVRFYRSVFLEEYRKDYVVTARAKGLSERKILFVHILKNASIPILTDAVMSIPFLFMGSLLLESFYSIPGLGSYVIDAIYAEDFAIVRAMVYIGSVLYIAGAILTDIAYSVVDPRIRLE